MGFELPYFEPKSNFLSMKLRGEQGLIQADRTVQINNMTMLFFDKDAGTQAHTTVTSSTATITPDSTQVSGPEDLQVVSPEFSLSGKDWVWNWKQNRLLIQQGVKLQLKQQLDPILQ
jgi:hypothetical protein